jgi:hypothetical protein
MYGTNATQIASYLSVAPPSANLQPARAPDYTWRPVRKALAPLINRASERQLSCRWRYVQRVGRSANIATNVREWPKLQETCLPHKRHNVNAESAD